MTPRQPISRPSWLSRFQRVTSGGAFLPEIDGLRIFAIALVFLWHFRTAILETAEQTLTDTNGPISYVVDRGFFGVQLFFAISGFILALPFARHALCDVPRPRLQDYYIRRLTRLEPPYILSLVLILVAKAHTYDLTIKSLMPHFWASIFYVHNVVYDSFSAISGVAWSLEVEVQFYIVAPLLGLIFKLRHALVRRFLFMSIAVMAIIAHIMVESRWGFHYRWTGTLPAQLQYFMVGMFLADVYVTHWQAQEKPSYLWDIAGLGGFYLLGYALHESLMTYLFGVLPAIFLIYAAALRGRLFPRFLRFTVVSTIGGMCYSIYLLHTWVIFFWYPIIRWSALPPSYSTRFLIFVFPVALSVVAVGGAYFALIERPCMDRTWPRRLFASIRRRFGRAR